MNIGKLGVFAFMDQFNAKEAIDFARKVEEWGYGALWYPEALGRNSMVTAAWLLSGTDNLVVASGIANVYARDAHATVAARHALNELSNGRFLLGLGVSHEPLVAQMRGHDFSSPLTFMESYLDKMAEAGYQAPPPQEEGEIVIGALGPKMTALAGRKTDGAYPYNVTPDHTAQARKLLGPDKKLYVEQKVMLETDPATARAAAREALSFYITLPNYRRNWDRLGFSKADYEEMSDRFLDAMVAWGDEAALRKRVEEHFQAGADHVTLQPLGDVDAVLKALAPGL